MAPDPTLTWTAAILATLACALLYWEARRRSTSFGRGKRAVGIALALAAVATYFNFFHLPREGYFHRWELFHYYLGSRYARELGYDRLYDCTVLAEAENGHRREVARRRLRDLRDDTMTSGRAVLEDPDRCKRHFDPERWKTFRRDVASFRRIAGGGRFWRAMVTDHGYNPTPVWTLTGHLLTGLSPPTPGFLRALASLDLLLMAATLGALLWAFGLRVMLLAAMFWGTQSPSSFGWTGFAFLRQDWLFLAVLALCLQRRGRYLAAGAALGTSALLRLFPVLLWAGPLLLALFELVRRRRVSRRYRRLAAGGVLAASLLVPASFAVTGPTAYPQFWTHIRMHSRTPIVNHMSLRTLFSATPRAQLASTREWAGVEPTERWAKARRRQLEEHRIPFWLCAAAIAAGFVLTVRGLRTAWIATGLSLVLVVTLTDPSCYYYSLWILAAPLSRARRSIEIATMGLAALSQLLAIRFQWDNDRYVALAALYVFFTVLLVCMFARRPRSARAGRS